MLGWLTAIANRRLLVAAGIAYVLGYITCSIHAFINGLGMLPALDAQYFIAGSVPLLTVIVVWLIIRGAEKLRGKYSNWFKKDMTPRKLRLAQAILILWIATGVLWFIMSELSERFLWLETVSLILVYVVMVIFILLPNVDYKFFHFNMEKPSRIQKGILFLVVLFFGFLGIVFYIESAYPKLPQEFGGVRPRYAYLDIVLDQTSSETLQEIVSGNTADANNTVVRSNMVDVYFSGSDVIIVKPHGQKGRDAPTYEIKQSIVKAVTWCSQNSTVE